MENTPDIASSEQVISLEGVARKRLEEAEESLSVLQGLLTKLGTLHNEIRDKCYEYDQRV